MELWFILSLIITFLLIVWLFFNISYPNTTISLKRSSSKTFPDWEYLIFWWILCHVIYFLNIQYQQLVLTCCNSIVPYYMSKGIVIDETKEGGIDNIPISVKNQINADNLHPEDSLLTWKSEIPSIVNKCKKIIIQTDVYDTDVSNYYDIRHVEFYNLDFFYQKATWWNILSFPHHLVHK